MPIGSPFKFSNDGKSLLRCQNTQEIRFREPRQGLHGACERNPVFSAKAISLASWIQGPKLCASGKTRSPLGEKLDFSLG